MQSTTQDWQETNRSLFTREANIIITFNRTDGRSPFISDTDIISFTHNKSGDVFNSALTQDTVTFTANNRNGILDYDETAENDVYGNTKIYIDEAFRASDYESYDSITGGTYYISGVKHDSDKRRYTFTAQTVLGFMTEPYEDDRTSSAYYLALSVIQQANESKNVPIDNIVLSCDEELLDSVDIEVRASDKFSLAVVLQLVASAAGCILYVDRNGRTIHIEKPKDTTDHYVLAKKFLYSPLAIEYADRIGDIKLVSDHGSSTTSTEKAGEKIGGRQIVTIPILTDYLQAGYLIDYYLALLQNGRKRFKAKCRFDPALDLFDVIVIPNDTNVDIAIITAINATYNGAWKADISAMVLSSEQITLDLRICDIELLTIAQFEHLEIEKLNPEQNGE